MHDEELTRSPRETAPVWSDAAKLRSAGALPSSLAVSVELAGNGQATVLGLRLIEVGPLGHVNSDSDLGAWPAGQELLTRFTASL